MKNILVPTDFSDNAWNAIQYGMALFKKTRCNFHLVHVSPITAYSGGEAAMYASQEILEQSVLKKCKQQLQQVLHTIERLPFNTKHTFHTSVHYGYFTDHIKEEVDRKHIDLIIMGTKGASGLKAVSVGTNTGNVMTKVPCAVLAVPEDAEYARPKEIGFATDFQLNYDIDVLQDLKELALSFKSALRFLYVTTKGERLSDHQTKNREFLRDYFEDTECSFHTLTGRKLDEAVQCFTESRNLDVLVMVAKNLNFLERILFRPTVEKISYHTTVPFLVLHELKK